MNLFPGMIIWLFSLTYIGCCGLTAAFPRMAHSLLNIKGRKWLEKTAAILAFVMIILYFATLRTRFNNWIINTNFILMTFSILYIILSNIIRMGIQKKGKVENTVFTLSISIITLILMPAFIMLDFFYDYIPFIHPYILKGFYTLPGFYFIWNLLFLIQMMKQQLQIKTKVLAFEINETNLSRFDLSVREIEILKLLIQGFSYKDIGKKVFIAPSTVKTHAIHIYQKTGAKNKIGLIHLLNK